MTLISKKIIYLSGDTSDVDQGFSRSKHTISYHVQSSLNFELDLKISWCHGLLTRYLVPNIWWRTFPCTIRFGIEKSRSKSTKMWNWYYVRYISVQQRFFKIYFQTALSLLVYVWRSLTFDHWTCYSKVNLGALYQIRWKPNEGWWSLGLHLFYKLTNKPTEQWTGVKKNILGEGGKKYTRLTLLLNFLILAFTEFWLTYVIAMFLNEGSLTATAFVAGKISIFLLEMFMLCYL